MSLVRPIIRMCARAALTGATWAEDRVFESDNTPLVDQISADAKPYICIYTDEDNRIEITGREYYAGTRNLSLVFEFGVAGAVNVDGSPELKIPQTDEGMECIVDILESQLMAVILGDPRNPWAELLRRFVLRIWRAPSHRGGSADGGTRWAARRVTLVCDVISDTPPGVVRDEDDDPVRDFIALARANSPSMGPAAEIVARILEGQAMPEWRQAQAWLTMTTEEIKRIGLAPLFIEGNEEPPPFNVVTVRDDDHNTETSSDEIILESPPEEEP